MSIDVQKIGQASIQGLGQFRAAHQGIPSGGAMDMVAAAWANRCVGNSAEANCLEIMGGGLQVRFNQATAFALTGAWGNVRLDATQLLKWGSYLAEPGQVLTIGSLTSGWWSYLSIPGGFEATSVIQPGAQWNIPADSETATTQVPRRFIPSYQAPLVCRYVPAQSQAIEGSNWQVSRHISRMGYRLEGPVINQPQPRYSAPIAMGAIQVPPDGQPIVLMRDHQTLGGYPVIGHVTRPSLGQLAQRRPGQDLIFEPIDAATARLEWTRYCEFFGPLA